MKIRFISTLFLITFYVHYVTGQADNSLNNQPLNNPTDDVVSYSGDIGSTNHPVTPGSTTGLAGTIRNTTSSILSRLEGPRDRVVEFIKPAVKSEFSRNVTNVLNSIWNRIQESNSSIIHNPLFKNAIVIPINTTLTRLRQITAAENENSEVDDSNLEVINLNRPEDEEQFKEYLQSSSNSKEAVSNPRVIFLVRDDDEKPAASEENIQTVPVDYKPNDKDDEVSNELVDTRTEPVQIESSSRPVDRDLNPTKSRRSARFMDNHYTVVTPSRVRNLFDNLQRQGMQECMALALCEANCRPQLYNQSRHGILRRLFDQVESFGSDHNDYDYYVTAKRYGQRFQDTDMNDCRMCHLRYSCEHDRDNLMDRFHSMGNFN